MGARPVTPVAILAARLGEAVALAESGAPGLLESLRAAHALAAGLDPYTEEMTSPASAPLHALAVRTAQARWDGPLEQEMLSGHVEGAFLAFLVRLTGARRVLEVGMFTGYSALAMAEALPPDGVVVACELDADVAAFAQECFAESDAGERIHVEVGPALGTLDRLAAQEPFDLVFVDADKAGYLEYVQAAFGGLLAPGGLVVVDNTLMQGLPWGAGEATGNGDAITVFNAAIAADERLEQVLLPIRDGITLIRRVDG